MLVKTLLHLITMQVLPPRTLAWSWAWAWAWAWACTHLSNTACRGLSLSSTSSRGFAITRELCTCANPCTTFKHTHTHKRVMRHVPCWESGGARHHIVVLHVHIQHTCVRTSGTWGIGLCARVKYTHVCMCCVCVVSMMVAVCTIYDVVAALQALPCHHAQT